ncbi:acyltransferase [Bradyrhizobium sp. CB3481]|uniref:acyltransferase family protein n=1 Tax=Bradyrhizobium sp. CB3481 TaxID=3039158 RepID=UPI0024B0C2E5|nr:acyltransferase [Bradyrhizobium sp. CB3481]WFU17035.1 acyltransferase [Bradyrhizobium sp. CB3481]
MQAQAGFRGWRPAGTDAPVDRGPASSGHCEPARLHELDSLRALAAIGVVGWHYTNHFGASPLPVLMAPFYRHGELLVDFFFLLSGFVLARVYWNDRCSAAFARNVRDRVARMYPLHLTTLCFVAVMQWILVNPLASTPFVYVFNDAHDFALNLALLNRTGLERGLSFNGPSWSISTEFVVNILFLAAIALPRSTARAVLFALFAVSLAVILKNGLVSDALAFGISNDVFRTIVGFVCGAALYHVHARWLSRIDLKRGFADGLAIAAVFVFLYYCARGELAGLLDLMMAVTCFPALIIGAIHGRLVKRFLTLRFLVYLGSVSYSLYLVHFPLQLAMHLASVTLLVQMPYDSALFLLGFIFATIGLASITYRLIEVPGKKLLRTQRMAALPEPLVSPR